MLGYSSQFKDHYDTALSRLSVPLQKVLPKQIPLSLRNVPDATDDDILEYYRHRGFPYLTYTSKNIKKDHLSLNSYDTSELEVEDNNYEDVIERNLQGLGMKAPNYFMRNVFDVKSEGKPSMLEVFSDDNSLLSVIETRREHASVITDPTMRTGLRLKASAPSSFPASIAKYVYDRFLLDLSSSPSPTPNQQKPSGTTQTFYKVLDPCAGFGGRMVGSQASRHASISYVEVDPWTENVENLEYMREWFEWENCSLIHSPFEDVGISKGLVLEEESFDLVFTSPPHFRKEIYTLEKTQSVERYPTYQEWKDNLLKALIQKSYRSLKRKSYIILHLSKMDEGLVQDAKYLMDIEGFSLC